VSTTAWLAGRVASSCTFATVSPQVHRSALAQPHAVWALHDAAKTCALHAGSRLAFREIVYTVDP